MTATAITAAGATAAAALDGWNRAIEHGDAPPRIRIRRRRRSRWLLFWAAAAALAPAGRCLAMLGLAAGRR